MLTPLFSIVLCQLLKRQLFNFRRETIGKLTICIVFRIALFYATSQLLNFWPSNASQNRGFMHRYVALRSDTVNVNAVACYIDHDTREHRGCIF